MKPPLTYLFITLFLVSQVTAQASSDGQAVFENNCASCHGLDGRAKTPQGKKLKAHDLRESKLTDAEIEHQIREGKKNAAGVLVMPAFGQDLSDEAIKAVVETVKAFRPSGKEG
jgi:mono/diheme cytochrome c family protein